MPTWHWGLLRHPLKVQPGAFRRHSLGDKFWTTIGGEPGRSSSHLSVWRERDEETVTSSTLQEPSSGATISEAMGPRSGPACMQMQHHHRACCIESYRLARHLPCNVMRSRLFLKVHTSCMRAPRHRSSGNAKFHLLQDWRA